MIILNFIDPFTNDPFTTEQLAQLKSLGLQTDDIRNIKVSISLEQPLPAQAEAIVEQAGLTPNEWRTQTIIVRPAALDAATLAIMAVMLGRMGFLPSIITMRRRAAAIPPVFDVWDIVDLQEVRALAMR